jgi:hypothetical protein
MRSDGSDRKVIVADCRRPDEGAIYGEAGHISWTKGQPRDERRLD